MGRPAVKAKTPMSAVGNEAVFARYSHTQQEAQRGLTLIELMVVISLIAIAVAGVSLSLRDPQASALEREAQRLSSVLEAARAQSRSTGMPLVWQARPEGFAVVPAAVGASASDGLLQVNLIPWLVQGLRVSIRHAQGQEQKALLLGAEPMMPAVTVVLAHGAKQIRLVTDGLRPFRVETADDGERAP